MKTLLVTLTLLMLCCGRAVAQPVPPAALQAARSMLRNIREDFPAFIRQVHPSLGLTYAESGKTFHGGRAFQKANLTASYQSGRKDAQIDADKDGEGGPYIVNTAQYLQEQIARVDFEGSRDVRFNIQGLPNSPKYSAEGNPASRWVSFHVNESGAEQGWNCLVLRLRQEGANYYISGIDYLYWLP